jgi:AcrR family transcriptional regulator
MATEVTREQVVDVALQMLRDGGVDALSMRRLAESLGASYQVVYSRIGGKGAVVRALHDRGFATLRTGVAALEARPGTTVHVEELAREYVRFALRDPELFEVMFASPVPDFTRDDEARAVEWEAFTTCWVAATGEWLAAHGADDSPRGAVVLAWRLWTAVHGIATVSLAGHSSPSGDAEHEAAAMVRLLLATSDGGAQVVD